MELKLKKSMQTKGTRTVTSREIDYESAFWKIRSQTYDNLEWANHKSYLEAFVCAGKFKKTDIVLDVGTGTGIIAHAISTFVKEVIGIDKSQDMLEHSNWYGNMYFIKRDIRNPIFSGGIFDKVTCRHVFHHILRLRQKAMNECYRVLKKGGLMILSEGVPPSKRVKKDYIEIFRLKEKRITFYEEDLVQLMKRAGFNNIKTEYYFLKNMSIRNWLAASGLPESTQKKIYMLHKNAGNYFKEDYNLIETEDDCLIDMKMIILLGKK